MTKHDDGGGPLTLLDELDDARDTIARQREALKETEQHLESLQNRYARATAGWDEAERRAERLAAALRDCVEDLESWSAYASDYFKRKHDLPGCLEKHRAALNPEGQDDD